MPLVERLYLFSLDLAVQKDRMSKKIILSMQKNDDVRSSFNKNDVGSAQDKINFGNSFDKNDVGSVSSNIGVGNGSFPS